MANLRASLFDEIEYLHNDGTWKLCVSAPHVIVCCMTYTLACATTHALTQCTLCIGLPHPPPLTSRRFTTTAEIKRLWTGTPSGDTSIEYNAQLGVWYMLHTAYLAPQILMRTAPSVRRYSPRSITTLTLTLTTRPSNRSRDRGPRLRRCTASRSRLTVTAMPSRPTPSSPPATRRSW